MIKTSAAYSKLATILGSRLVNRARTLHEAGQPTKVFSETLLLIPKDKALAIGVPEDAEIYTDKKTQEEFVAIRVSATTPRLKGRAPAPPPNPLRRIRPVFGQGGYDEGNAIMLICPGHDENCPCKELMAKVSVRIVCATSSLSKFRCGQIYSQLAVYEENQRIGSVLAAIRKTGCSRPGGFLQFVPATEADSILLVGREDDDMVLVSRGGPSSPSEAEDDSSVHSTIPLPANTPAKYLTGVSGIGKELREKFEREYDAREPKRVN